MTRASVETPISQEKPELRTLVQVFLVNIILKLLTKVIEWFTFGIEIVSLYN